MTADRGRVDRGDRAHRGERAGATAAGVCAELAAEAQRLQSREKTAITPTSISFDQAVGKMRSKQDSMKGCDFSNADEARRKQQDAIEEALQAQARNGAR